MVSKHKFHPDEIRSLVLRDFQCSGPTSFVVLASGGLGDMFVAAELVWALKQVPEVRALKKVEWILVQPPAHVAPLARFFDTLGIFDQVVSDAQFPLKVKYKVKELNLMLGNSFIDAHIGLGTTYDFAWARWGLPGRFIPAPRPELLKRLKQEVRKMPSTHEILGVNEPIEAHYLLAMSSNSFRELKRWPIQEWRKLIDEIHDTGARVIIVASEEDFLSLGPTEAIHFGFGTARKRRDIMDLVALLMRSRGMAAIDSGPAHLAGFLNVPCVSLWGPTAPQSFAHPNNTAIRLSPCTPCAADLRSNTCRKNACMRAIPAPLVAETLFKNTKQ